MTNFESVRKFMKTLDKKLKKKLVSQMKKLLLLGTI